MAEYFLVSCNFRWHLAHNLRILVSRNMSSRRGQRLNTSHRHQPLHHKLPSRAQAHQEFISIEPTTTPKTRKAQIRLPKSPKNPPHPARQRIPHHPPLQRPLLHRHDGRLRRPPRPLQRSLRPGRTKNRPLLHLHGHRLSRLSPHNGPHRRLELPTACRAQQSDHHQREAARSPELSH